MIVEARRARPADLPELARLRSEADAELAPLRGGALFVGREAPPLPGWLDDDGTGDGAAVWVGAIDDAPVGYAVARLDPGRDGRLLVRIDDLYVEPGARQVGLGEALMAAVLAWAAEEGASGVDAVALPGARETKNFFETSGFTARKLVMHKPLA